jgi:hypothetical protein
VDDNGELTLDAHIFCSLARPPAVRQDEATNKPPKATKRTARVRARDNDAALQADGDTII